MTAAAWIALVGVAITFVLNLVLLTRFLTKLESRDALLQLELKNLSDKTESVLGHVRTDVGKIEQRMDRHDTRISNLERTVGRSADLRD